MAPGDQNPEVLAQAPTPVESAREQTERELREGVDARLTEHETKDPILKGIESIDSSKPLTEQIEKMADLEVVLDELILLALNAGEKKEELAKSPLILKGYAKNPTAQVAVEKFGELISTQSKETLQWWAENLEQGAEHYADAVEEKEKTEKKETSDKTQWMSPTIKFGLIAAGAAGGAYFLYKWFTKKEGEKKTSDLVIGGVLATLGVGTLLGSETLGKWAADYLNLDISADAIKDLLSGKGISSLTFSSREPGIKKAAKELNITERTLIDLKDTKWGDFSSLRTQLARTGGSYMRTVLEQVGMSDMPGVSIDEDSAIAREEVKLESFIKRHKDKIKGDIDKKSIGEILNELEAAGVFSKSQQVAEEAVDPETDPDDLEVRDNLSATPSVAEVWEKLKSGEMEWDEGLAALKPAADEDGAGLGIVNGTLFLIKGSIVVPLSSLGIVVSQAKDMWDFTQGNGSLGEALWESDQIYWAGAYATYYGGKALVSNARAAAKLNGRFSIGNVLAETAKGGGKGIIDSYLFLPKTVIKGLRWKTEGGQLVDFARLTAKEHLPFMSPAERVHVLHEQSAYYGERYKYYHEKLEVFESQKLTGKVESTFYEKIYGKKWLENMMEKYAERFLTSRKAFLKETGAADTLGADVTLASIKTEKGIQGRLADAAEKFVTENPKSALPEVPAYRVTAPKHATHAEATAAGTPKLAEGRVIPADLSTRMETLGLKGDRITLKLREYGMTKTDLEALCTELERLGKGDPALAQKLARDLEFVLFKIKNPRLFAGASALGKAAGIIGTLYMLYDFQESKDKWNTAGEDASMLATFTLGGRLTATAIPHPIGKAVGFVVGGTVASFGGQAAWNSYGKPYLQKHFPNRQDFFDNAIVSGTGTYLSMMTGGVFINDVIFAADAMGIGDGIDEETDPLAYLTETKYVGHPDFIGTNLTSTGEHRMHDLSELRSNGQEALEAAQEELKDLQKELAELSAEELTTEDLDRKETIGIKKEEIQKEIQTLERNAMRFQSYTDDTWIDVKQMELIYVQTEMIEPAFQKFQVIVEKKFGAEGLEAFARLMGRMQEGRDGVKGDLEMEVWQYLCDQSAELGEGETVGFADFATFTVSIYQSAKQLEVIKEELATEKGIFQEGEETSTPVDEKSAAQ